MRVEMHALFVKVASEQNDGVLSETNGFDPSVSTAFTECLRFVLRTKHCPVGQHETTHFRDSCPRLKEQPGYHFITKPGVFERQLAPGFQNISWQVRIIDDLGLPLLMF